MLFRSVSQSRYAPTESKEVLEQIGLTHQLRKSEEKVATQNALNHFKTKFETNTYTGDQIRTMCNVYDLKMLPSHNYKGQLDPSLVSVLKQFSDKNYETNKIVPRQRDYFILAPRESFENNCTGTGNVMFFYRETGESRSSNEYAKSDEVFSLVHSWGEDLKPIRKARFLFYSPMVKDDGIFSSTITISTNSLTVS